MYKILNLYAISDDYVSLLVCSRFT